MTIILFHGGGTSKKLLNYIYDGKTYNKNDFIKQLEKNHTVFIPNIPYTNIHYYDEYTIMKPMFTPINNINYDVLSLDKFITKLYNSMDKKKYRT